MINIKIALILILVIGLLIGFIFGSAFGVNSCVNKGINLAGHLGKAGIINISYDDQVINHLIKRYINSAKIN